MNVPDRLVTPPPFAVDVACSGRTHAIEVRDGEIHVVDHPLEEQVLEALGAPPSGCRAMIHELGERRDELAEGELLALRTGVTSIASSRGTHRTTTIPAQLTRLTLLEQIVAEASIRPHPARYVAARSRWIADLVFDRPGLRPSTAARGTVTIVDEWLASIFVLGLEYVQGIPISAMDRTHGELRLLSLVSDGDEVVPRQLEGNEIKLPAGLRLLS